MILRLLKGRGMVSGRFEKKRDAISPHPAPLQAQIIDRVYTSVCVYIYIYIYIYSVYSTGTLSVSTQGVPQVPT
jgi:hypothetical protein